MVVKLKITSDVDEFGKIFKEISMHYKGFFLGHTRDVLLFEQKTNNFPNEFLTIVDGKIDAPPSTVKPFGKISFLNTGINVSKLLQESYQAINDRSPIGVGGGTSKGKFSHIKYKDFNQVFVNDRIVARDAKGFGEFLKGDAKNLGDGDKVTFINVVPYARKLERRGVSRGTRGKSKGISGSRGVKKGRNKKLGITFTKPNGTYAISQRVISRIWKGRGRVSRVRFIPLDISVGGMGSRFKDARSIGGVGRPYLYPTIEIIISGKGFKGIKQ